jgi:glycosyltransferase involved in cell wall biosynthesis
VYREVAQIATVAQGQGALDVCVLSASKACDHGILDRADICTVPTASMVFLADPIPTQLERAWLAHGGRAKDLRRARWLARRWRRLGIAVVHVHFLGFSAALAAVACEIAEIPLVLTVHARGLLVADSMAQFTLTRTAKVIAISGHTRGLVSKLSQVNCTVLPLVVDHATVTPSATGAFHVLTVARPVAKKGYPVLRQAIEKLDFDVRWTVIGATEAEVGGPMDGLNALGAQSFAQVRACYDAGVDVFALACCTAPDGDEDGVPVAILEAMARGVAVVTTSVGGLEELVVDGENGLLVTPDDPAAFAQALARLKSDKVLALRFGRKGRADVRQHRCPDARLLALMACFENVLKGAV